MRCLNWKVLAGLVAIGVALYAFAPGVVVAAAPLLVLALCPLSMLVMMRAMGSMRSCEPTGTSTDSEELARLRAEVQALRSDREVS